MRASAMNVSPIYATGSIPSRRFHPQFFTSTSPEHSLLGFPGIRFARVTPGGTTASPPFQPGTERHHSSTWARLSPLDLAGWATPRSVSSAQSAEAPARFLPEATAQWCRLRLTDRARAAGGSGDMVALR